MPMDNPRALARVIINDIFDVNLEVEPNKSSTLEFERNYSVVSDPLESTVYMPTEGP